MNCMIKYKSGRLIKVHRVFANSKSEAFKTLPKKVDEIIYWAAWKY